MKKKYESPALYAEVFSADQNVAATCTPGVKEEQVSAISVDCASSSSFWTVILAAFGLAHDHGLGFTLDSKNCISTASTTIFSTSGCTTKVDEGDVRNYNGTSYIAASWDSNSPRGKHTALYNNGSAGQPTYWNS